MKTAYLLAFLFIAPVSMCARAQSTAEGAAIQLYALYQSGDTTQISSRWKHDKDERFDIGTLLEMQRDVFGTLIYPEKYELRNAPFNGSKETVVSAEFKKSFLGDSTSELNLILYKGAKKNDQFLIQGIRISCFAFNAFADSISGPALQMIRDGKIDSLCNLAFRITELKAGLENVRHEFSTQELEKMEQVIDFMKGISEMYRPQIESIDFRVAPTFKKCILSTKRGESILEVKYDYVDKKGERLGLTFGFTKIDDGYKISNLGVSTGANPFE